MNEEEDMPTFSNIDNKKNNALGSVALLSLFWEED
jgi:hypothetical protein